jgi:hypothetical protein
LCSGNCNERRGDIFSLFGARTTAFALFRLSIILSLFAMLQAGVSGFVVGVLFQYFYNRSANSIPEASPVGAVAERERIERVGSVIAPRTSP